MRIPSSEILVTSQGHAKNNFKVELIAPGEAESRSCLKTYGDFKRLYLYLQQSDLQCQLAALPAKLNINALRRPNEVLQKELEVWL